MVPKLNLDELDKFKIESIGMIMLVVLTQFVTTQPLLSEKLYLNYLFFGYTIYVVISALLVCGFLLRNHNDNDFTAGLLKMNIRKAPPPMWKNFATVFYVIVVGMLIKAHMYPIAGGWIFAAIMQTTMLQRQEKNLSKEGLSKYHQRVHTYYEKKLLSVTDESTDTDEAVRSLVNEIRARFDLPVVQLSDDECKIQLNELKDAVFGGYRLNSDELLFRLKEVVSKVHGQHTESV